MPVSAGYTPSTAFAALGPAFGDVVAPASFPKHVLRFRNQRWAGAVGLAGLTAAEWEEHFARFAPLPANLPQPIAIRYHGHQFRVYNPDLGDGRGFLFAQLRDGAGRLLDLGTKGSGQTPWSRAGDGRLTLKGAVREILATEMLEALGVPTSKTFSVFETGEDLQRQDEPSPTRSAVLVRLSHSHVRFGAFQRQAYLENKDGVAALTAYAIDHFYPHLRAVPENARTAAFFGAVVAASAKLAAAWMAAGFVHGVLNTDNMNITGESFDYGPWRFLPASAPGFTAAYFDHQGLYAFGRQPEAVSWNLAQLGACLTMITPQEALVKELEQFGPLYQRALRDAMFQRLALAPTDLEADLDFLQNFFHWMTESEAVWDQTFHDLFAADPARIAASPQAALYHAPAAAAAMAGLKERAPVRPERLSHLALQAPNPPSLVIGEVEALWAPIAEADDWSALETKLAAIAAYRDALDICADPADARGEESGLPSHVMEPSSPALT
jgi:uncharacterized protein YdiU (UPF0061 family)